MKHGVLFFAVSVVVSFGAWYLGPLREVYDVSAVPAITFAAVGAVVLISGLFVAYLLDRHSPFSADGGSCSLKSPRVAIVLMALIASEFIITYLLEVVFHSSGLAEFASYEFVLFVGAVVIARWCRARAYVAPSVAVVVFATLVTWAFIRFVTSSAANFQFGPERWLFALQMLSGGMATLPLDIAVAFTAWRLFSRRRTALAQQ